MICAVDVQDNRLEAELSAWGVIEVGEADASRVRGWGSPEFKGLMFGGKWYRLRRWALDYQAVSTAIQAARTYGQALAEFVETPRPHGAGPHGPSGADRDRQRRPLLPNRSPSSCGRRGRATSV